MDLRVLDLTGLIVQVVEQLLPRAATGQVKLSSELPPSLPAVLCDPDQVQQVC